MRYYDSGRVETCDGKSVAIVGYVDIGPDGTIAKQGEKTFASGFDTQDRHAAERFLESKVAILRKALAQDAEPRAALSKGFPDAVQDVISHRERLGIISHETAAQKRYHAKRIRGALAAKVGQITPSVIMQWLEDELDAGTSIDSLMKAVSLGSQTMGALGMASNPFDAVEKPKARARIRKNSLSPVAQSRLLRLLRELKPCPFVWACVLALQTGMRRGELCALRWADIDFPSMRICVASALARAKGGWEEKPPKTGRSRYIPINQGIFETFEAIQEAQRRECRRARAPFKGSLYVLGSPYGDYLNPEMLTKQWRSFSEVHEVEGVLGERASFHDLRHTFASTWLSRSLDVKSLSEILGHASAKMTLDTYGDVLPTAKRDGMISFGAYQRSLERSTAGETGEAPSQPPLVDAFLIGSADTSLLEYSYAHETQREERVPTSPD